LSGGIILNAKQEIAAKNIVNIKVFGPDGVERQYYMQNIEVAGGSTEYTIKTAINDESGKWKIVARDAVTGKTDTVSFSIN